MTRGCVFVKLDPMKRRITVRGIFVHEGRLLCVKLKPYNDKDVDFWCIVGGGIELGESLEDALKREVIEETGIEPVIGKLLYIQQFIKSSDMEGLEFFFEIKNPEDYVNVDLSKTSHGEKEIEQIDYIDPSEEKYRVLPAFLRTIDFDKLPESTVIYNYM